MEGIRVVMERPAASNCSDERVHAPHMLVLVFARGLLRHLISRVYFGDELANESDPVLVSNSRRAARNA